MCADYSDDPALMRMLAALVLGEDAPLPPPAARERLLASARQHRVAHLIAWRVRESCAGLDAWFGDAAAVLDAELREMAVLDTIRTRELASVLDELEGRAHAAPLVFKGAALAFSHYPHPWLRPRHDADILIAPDRQAAAFDTLAALGYARQLSTEGSLVLAQAAFERTDRFGVTHVLDIHWQIANWHVVAAAASHADLAGRAVSLDALGASARTPAPPDALLLACLHRAAHHRDSQHLLWLYDIHLLAGRLTGADWQQLVATAERGRVKTLCRRGLELASNAFRTTVPPFVAVALADAGEERSSIYAGGDVRLVDALVADLRTLPMRSRLRLLAEHAWPPAEYMRRRYGVRSRLALGLTYARRLVTGVPKWFVSGGWS